MKKFFLLPLLLLAACASNPHRAKYAVEKNAPKFKNSRSYVESPGEVRIAARAALDELTNESEPPVTGTIKDGDVLRTGWVYGLSKNRWVEFKSDGKPGRKPLRTRRKYGYAITPSIAGSDVAFQVEEEIMQLDLKTGEDKGWKRSEADPAVYDAMAERLLYALRRQ